MVFKYIKSFHKNNEWLISILMPALFLRLLLAYLPGFSFDIDAWFAWAIRLEDLGFRQFYSDSVWTNYTPGYLYVLYLLGFLNSIFHFSGDTFHIILKLPAIIADLFIAVFIYKILEYRTSYQSAKIAVILFLFNPGLIFNSAVWGQIDSFLTFFLLLSVLFLTKHKLALSSIIIAIACLIKPQALALAPLFLIFIIKNFSIKNLALLTLPGLLTLLLLSFPFFSGNPLVDLFNLVFQMSRDYPRTSLYAYNFWGIVGMWIDDQNTYLGITYQAWGILMFALLFIIVLISSLKQKQLNYYLVSSALLLMFYFLPTRVHDRYLYPAIPFLLITAAFYRSKILFVLTAALSLIYFINLYFVYVYYNEFYLQNPKVLYLPLLYDHLESKSWIISAISFLVFLLIYFNILRLNHAAKDQA